MEKQQPYPAIEVRNLTKIYKLHSSSLRELLSTDEQQRIHGDNFYALKNVSFSIAKGQVVGVVGKNGSGKTTLLQILSKITKPTDGEAILDGRVSAILDVDSGFHPDLSGRENVFLRGAIMGMKHAEIEAKFESIVDFSEIRPFIDEPVKAYSNGMFVRLAFAIVAHLESEIVLIDEVISVGDADFRAKSFDKIRELASSGKTVVIISHELLSVVELCQSVILLKDGEVHAHGLAKQVVGEYLQEVVLSRYKAGEGSNALIEKLRNEVGLINSKIEGLKEKLATTADDAIAFQIDQLISSRKEISDRLNLELQNQNEGRKLPNSLSWLIKDAPGTTDIRLLSVSCRNYSGASSINQLSEVCVEMTYQKLTSEPTLPTLLLSYQMSNMALAGNPLFSNELSSEKFDTLPGTYTRKCVIPAKTLNVGLFSVGLTFVDQFAEEISQHADLVYFKVDYVDKMFDNYVYNGRFPGPLFLEMDWSLSMSPELTT